MISVGTYCIFKCYADAPAWLVPVLCSGDRVVIVEADDEGAFRCIRVDELGHPVPKETELVFMEELIPLALPHLGLRHILRAI